MPSTGPRGKRRVIPSRPVALGSVSSRCNSPDQRRASSAAQRKVETARLTSPLDHISGLPFSAVISAANSSARWPIRAEMWSSALARTCAGSPSSSAWTASAAAIACSIWSDVASETRPTRSPE